MHDNLIKNSHLLPLNINDHIDEESDSESSLLDSDIEITDTGKINDDFIQLNLNNDDDSTEDEFESSTNFDNNEEIICIQTPHTSTATTTDFSTHHTRRQWTVAKKLKTVSELNNDVSSHALESKYKCTRKMIREWKKNENELISLVKDKDGKGRKRKRIDGAGSKLTY